jgi:hypothetical protein
LKRRVVTLKLTDVSEVCTAITALMMAAVRTSETSINFNVSTRRYIPEDSKHHTRRREIFHLRCLSQHDEIRRTHSGSPEQLNKPDESTFDRDFS